MHLYNLTNSTSNTITDSNYDLALTMFYNFESGSNLISPLLISYILGMMQIAEISKSTKLYKIMSFEYDLDDLKMLADSYQSNLIYIETWLISRLILDKTWLNEINDLLYVVNDGQVHKIMQHIQQLSGYQIDITPKENSINFANVCIVSCQFKNKFNRADTMSTLFFETDNTFFMRQIGWFNYYEDTKIKLVEILMEDEAYSLGIILPVSYIQATNTDYTINNLPYMTKSYLQECINNMAYTQLYLSIPKFKHIKNVNVMPILNKMGIEIDLTSINENARLDNIACQTIFIVGDSITNDSKLDDKMIDDAKIKFIANHPFVYYLRNIQSNLIVAIGDYQGYSI